VSDLNNCLYGKPNWFTNVITPMSKYGFLHKKNEVVSTRNVSLPIDYAVF
jgi:hypothetical protein